VGALCGVQRENAESCAPATWLSRRAAAAAAGTVDGGHRSTDAGLADVAALSRGVQQPADTSHAHTGAAAGLSADTARPDGRARRVQLCCREGTAGQSRARTRAGRPLAPSALVAGGVRAVCVGGGTARMDSCSAKARDSACARCRATLVTMGKGCILRRGREGAGVGRRAATQNCRPCGTFRSASRVPAAHSVPQCRTTRSCRRGWVGGDRLSAVWLGAGVLCARYRQETDAARG
jgi:hypothetical protein